MWWKVLRERIFFMLGEVVKSWPIAFGNDGHEYVTQLTAYKKWAQITPALQVGDLVLVSDDRLPRLRWKLGRIQEIFKGRDGLVHSALVKTSQGVFRRRITVLHMLEAADTLKADKT